MRNVAIACQGGGSHTAFTGGALTRLVPAVAADDDHRLVALSGTSGGAFSADAAWYGLLTDGPDRAVDCVEALWADIAADDFLDRAVNDLTVFGARVANHGLAVPEVSPYASPTGNWGQRQLRETLERHVDFDAIPDRVAENADAPQLFVGTVDVNGGRFECFADERVTVDVLLASAAVPELFRAVRMNGHAHWDGLFSQNPPIRDLLSVPVERKPDELWVIQVNPQERADEPRSLHEIVDRRNELAGNLSLNQELRFVETVNEWVEAGHLPREEFRPVCVDRIQLDGDLGYSSKLDRDPAFIDDLMAQGRDRADELLVAHGLD